MSYDAWKLLAEIERLIQDGIPSSFKNIVVSTGFDDEYGRELIDDLVSAGYVLEDQVHYFPPQYFVEGAH